MKILLHTCCAPCLIYPYEVLTARGYEVFPFFYNPNIHPYREYRDRFLALADYCSGRGIGFKAGPYEMERFLIEVSPHLDTRCGLCYRVRLERSAAEARASGIGEFTTTLLVSPHQDRGLIRDAGEAAALRHGVLFRFEDMSGGYTRSVETSKRLKMYRQSYCGCVYSEKEKYQKEDPPRR